MITLHHGNSLDVIEEIGDFDMIFADPPDNIGLGYSGFEDKFEHDAYVSFLGALMGEMIDHAPISWMSFNAKWWMEVGQQIHELGLYVDVECRLFVQTFTFGNNRRTDFTNGFRPIVRFMRHDADPHPDSVYVPSWRQLNGDPRASDKGKMPDDVWAFPRVTGNSKQRRDWSPTQLHEDLYRRAIDFSCYQGSRICDMFAGSGTMARVAGETHDVHLIELSDETAQHIYEEHQCDCYCYQSSCSVC